MLNLIEEQIAKNSGIVITRDGNDACIFLGRAASYALAGYSNPDIRFVEPGGREVIVINSKFKGPFEMTKEISILFHEAAHATGRRGRLERKAIMVGSRCVTDQDYAVEEVIAEKAARILLEHFRLLTPSALQYHENYITRYKDDIVNYSDWELHIEREARKAANYILEMWIRDVQIVQESVG